MDHISDVLDSAKKSLKELEKKHKYKKASRERNDAIELQTDLAKCHGDLEACKNQFGRTILTQSLNIKKGLSEGIDVAVQRKILQDSALGYLLVRDAIFAIESVNSYESVAHAYEMLDAAMREITGSRGLPRFPHISSSKKRNEYGYINSQSAVKQKKAIVNAMQDELEETGDIEECLKHAENPADTKANRDHKASSYNDDLARIRAAEADDEYDDDYDDLSTDSDVHAPKNPDGGE